MTEQQKIRRLISQNSQQLLARTKRKHLADKRCAAMAMQFTGNEKPSVGNKEAHHKV
ncbi:hypothetical protein [Photobacterium proteolyticum]|uniref:hypothetical protein n=1 Tax=Photobacterium proteolyticum TaxID=1903952 RepID=UPI0015880C37|nr:hypothetical protein [Photobacterium proteolyticum]